MTQTDSNPLQDVADVFCLGPQPMQRWRAYIPLDDEGRLQDVDWTPASENDRLIAQKTFHARCAYQYSFCAEYAREHGWETHRTFKTLALIAVLEMRYMELCLVDFQLLTNAIGIDNRTTDRDELYFTAKLFHSTHLWLHDAIALGLQVRPRDNNRKEVMQDAPSLVATKVQLARSVCCGVRAVKMYFQPAFASLRIKMEKEPTGGTEQELEKLAKRMQLVMMQLDRVVVVLGEDRRCGKVNIRSL